MDKTNSFSWIEEEMQLLLEAVLYNKSDKAANGFDRESIELKNLDIRDIFVSRYPKGGENAGFSSKNPRALFTKERLITNIKSLRNKFKVALDTGRKSGGRHAGAGGLGGLQPPHFSAYV